MGNRPFIWITTRINNTKKYDIVVVGTQTLFIITEGGGKLRYQRRLDYPPSCIKTYHLNHASEIYRDEKRNVAEISEGDANSPCFTFLLGSFSNYILVYRDVQLVWTCKTSHSPIFCEIAEFQETEGLIVHFADNGWLQVSYLGTEPPKLNYILPESKDMKYEEMEAEHQRLLSRILANEQDEKTEPDFTLSISTEMDTVEEADEYIDDPENIYAKREGATNPIRIKCKFILNYNGEEVKNLMVNIIIPDHCEVDKKVFSYKILNFGGQSDYSEIFYIYPRNDYFPVSNEVVISASYMSTRSAGGVDLRTAWKTFELPMALSCKIIAPSNLKNTNKITIVTDKDAAEINGFFEDVIAQLGVREICTTPNVMSFMYHNGVIVTVLISKNAGKFRIQSSSFDALGYIVQELVKRINIVYSDDVKIDLQDSIPLHELFISIDDHFELREKIFKGKQKLEDRSYQFRIVEKRLINRFKDKNPTPLNNLDFLLNQTYQDMMNIANEILEDQKELKTASQNLSSRIRMIQILLKQKFKISDESFELLKHHLSADIHDFDEWGWEEHTYAAMTNLLKTSLAKSSKESNASNASIKKLADTTKLKKHLTIVCDRLARGGIISL